MNQSTRNAWGLTASILLISCGQSPSAPSNGAKGLAATFDDSGGVSSHADGDVKTGTGALEIERLRMDRQTPSGASVYRQYVFAGQTYPMLPGETIELWVEWRTPDNPRLIVDWGAGEPNSPDFINCGSCLIKHTYPKPGLYRVVVTLDDRASTMVTRTFFLDSRTPATATPTPTPTPGGPQTFQFCNPGVVTIDGDGSATPYPSSITVSNVPGTISKVTATMLGWSVPRYFSGTKLQVRSPGDQALMLMTNLDGGATFVNVDATFDDDGDRGFPLFGTFGPGSLSFYAAGGNGSPLPFPGPYGGDFTTFEGTNPNGSWRLFVQYPQFNAGRQGDMAEIARGWCINITTVAGSPEVR